MRTFVMFATQQRAQQAVAWLNSRLGYPKAGRNAATGLPSPVVTATAAEVIDMRPYGGTWAVRVDEELADQLSSALGVTTTLCPESVLRARDTATRIVPG